MGHTRGVLGKRALGAGALGTDMSQGLIRKSSLSVQVATRPLSAHSQDQEPSFRLFQICSLECPLWVLALHHAGPLGSPAPSL